MNASPMQFILSPSRIARYYYHECGRYLRYHATPKNRRKACGVPETEGESSPLSRAVSETAYRWEEKVLRKYLKGRVKIARGKGKIYERVFSAEESISLMKKLGPGQSIYQPVLEVPPSFYKKFGIDTALCHFPPCRPDLIHFHKGEDGKAVLRIIDMKAPAFLKAGHRIQVSLYALILAEIIASRNLPLPPDTETGGIWLYEAEKPEYFDLRFSRSSLKYFLRGKLHPILSAPPAQVPWHLFFRCERCEFYLFCRKEAEEKNSVSLLPCLSAGGRGFLRNLSPPVNSLEEMEQFLAREDADDLLECCGSLRGKKERLQKSLRALAENRVIPYGGSSLLLPLHEDVNIMITVQEEALSGKIYAAGFRRLKGGSVYGNGCREEIFIARNPEDCAEIQADFLRTLHRELEILDDYNRKREREAQKTLQVYVFDSYESRLFHRLLQETMQVPEPDAPDLIFCFQDASLAGGEKHPADQGPFSIAVLTSLIRRLLALPLPLCLRLPEVLSRLPAPDFDYSPAPSPLFWSELSNTLKSDVIFSIWHEGKTERTEWIENEIRKRLTAAQAVVDGIRAKVRGSLFARPPKFRFPEILHFQHRELSRLAYIVRYESCMAAMQMREARTAPLSERIRNGFSIPVAYAGGQRWKVLSGTEADEIETGGFPNYLLVPFTEEGEKAQMCYDDYHYRRALFPPRGEICLAAVREVEKNSGGTVCVSLFIRENSGRDYFDEGEKYILHPRFTDFNSDRILQRLAETDAQPEHDFLKLLRDPPAFASKIPWPGKRDCIRTAGTYAGFTSSQAQAFRHVLENRLTLVWGPPGTGKTHFLAKTVLTLFRTALEKRQTLRIAVTAFTHAAIENLLEEIRLHRKDFGLESCLSLYKMKYISVPRGEELEVIQEKELWDVMEAELLVVGGTVYSFLKSGVEGEFPLLIADEASQMKWGELALAVNVLGEKGRLLLAGDDLQLPPIISGEYPESEDGLPGFHESVFAFLRARDREKSPYTCQLQENWRMNATLSLFPARTLYGKAYRPVCKEIGKQKIALKAEKGNPFACSSPEAVFCQWLLDPAYPLCLCISEDMRAAVENPAEARLTALLAEYLRENLLQENSRRPYPRSASGDRAFGREGLFIVSPHHAQIRLIRKELNAIGKWNVPPFVDTVDKMQGQQCRNVIVSYGVSDAETALSESSFIYSVNRLNVSVTRARAKCIVFLSRPLLQPSFALLENEKALRGLEYMLALSDFCTGCGDEKEWDISFAGGRGKMRCLRAGSRR